jgi:endoplasmic reticulum-Golgi intermediate compartment protein 3
MSLDLMDISGELQRDISHDIIKTRLSAAGTAVPGAPIAELSNDIDKMDKKHAPEYCGSCFGGEPPESGCCNSCDEVREAYTRKGWSFGNPDGIDQVRIFFLSPLSSSRADS